MLFFLVSLKQTIEIEHGKKFKIRTTFESKVSTLCLKRIVPKKIIIAKQY